MPPRGDDSDLGSIKSSVLGRSASVPGTPKKAPKPASKTKEPPRPPLIAEHKPTKSETASETRAAAKNRPKPNASRRRIKDVHVIRETIREVPVMRKAPVMKRVPAFKGKISKVPAGDTEIAKKIEGSLREISNIKLDVARQGQECSQMFREINSIKQRLKSLDGMKSELKSLGRMAERMDFQGLTKEIYNQFDKMNNGIKESGKRTDDLSERFNVEIKTLKEKMGEVDRSKEQIESLDIANVRRDMESLKQKLQYIEQNLDRFDFKPVMEMIKEVDNKINNLRASSALIIE
jgi:hypothetical protein